MTVSTQTSKKSHDGDGVTTSFAIPFMWLDDDDIKIYVVDADNVETLKSVSDYTLAGVGEETGGTVTCDTFVPASTERLVIVREMAPLQDIDYVTGGAFPADAHEGALDRLTLLVQQYQEILDRCLQLSQTSDGISV